MVRFIYFFILIILLSIVVQCDEEKVILNNQAVFAIREVHIPAYISSTSDKSILITADVTHPEGPDGLRKVELVILNSSGQEVKALQMADDGSAQDTSSGDVIAFDNVFSVSVVGIRLGLADATYQVKVRAEDISGEITETDFQQLEIFPNQPPEILSVIFPDSIKSGMKAEEVYIEVADNEGLDDILRVIIRGFSTDTGLLVFTDSIPNPMNNSPVFSRTIDSSYAAAKMGTLELRITAVDRVGEEADPFLKTVFFENNPPAVSDPKVPDSLILPASASGAIDTLITVMVSDPQSLADIEEVYFYSLKPDSTFANNGNPFFMWDNGLPFLGDPARPQYAGDKAAGDGIFSFTVVLFGDAQPGQYVFSFYAKDKVEQESVVIRDTVVVTK